jgi:hypothetical protein
MRRAEIDRWFLLFLIDYEYITRGRLGEPGITVALSYRSKTPYCSVSMRLYLTTVKTTTVAPIKTIRLGKEVRGRGP